MGVDLVTCAAPCAASAASSSSCLRACIACSRPLWYLLTYTSHLAWP